MKVLIVNGSPHIEGGCTDRALKEVEKTLNDNGIATERVNIGSCLLKTTDAADHC